MRAAMQRLALAFFTLVVLATSALASDLPSAQPYVDAAEEGGVVILPPGRYAGPLVIEKPITLDGKGQVVIDGGGKGSVVVVKTNGAAVQGLHLTGSGDQHNDVDSGIQVQGDRNIIRDNVIEDSLFGIDLAQSSNNVVRRNRIYGKKLDLGVRGDAIRLWYSYHNRVEENEAIDSRDMVVWYSSDNIIRRNKASGGRYGLHFMYSKYNLVEENIYEKNAVGIILMYSDGIIVRNNKVRHSIGSTGVGIGLKETSDVIIENNEVVYCSTGIYLDVSPFQPDTTNRVRNNLVAFNSIGILFHNDWTGNVIRDNRFEANFVQASVNARASAARNEWDGNFWDDYEGFDRNRDGIGDNSYELRVYADRLWMDVPYAAFYKGSLVLGLLDFLERLAPFTDPILLLKDERPKMHAGVVIPREPDEDEVEEEEEAGGSFDPFGLKERGIRR